MKVGLALSGGGVRGIAHLGVLKALEEREIKVHTISGASSGSLVAALYAAGYTVDQIHEFGKKFTMRYIVRPRLSRMGFSTFTGIEKKLLKIIPHNSFEQLQIPLYVSLTDLLHGKPVIKKNGPLNTIVMASCSLPIISKPVYIDGVAYADGGIMNNLPVKILRDKVDVVIGVNLIVNPILENTQLSSMIKMGMRTFELSVYQNSLESLKLCDIKIQPHKLAKVSIFKHKNIDEVFDIGYQAAQVEFANYFGG